MFSNPNHRDVVHTIFSLMTMKSLYKLCKNKMVWRWTRKNRGKELQSFVDQRKRDHRNNPIKMFEMAHHSSKDFTMSLTNEHCPIYIKKKTDRLYLASCEEWKEEFSFDLALQFIREMVYNNNKFSIKMKDDNTGQFNFVYIRVILL